MNKNFIFSVAALLLLISSCSNDDKNATEEGKINATKTIEFKVDFADYNAEQNLDVTRANKEKEVKFEQQTVDLNNCILAQYTLQRDTTKQTKLADTRALANDTYTMLAYDAATHTYKGDITGTVTGGVFTPTSTNQDIVLAPGTYDFVLYNSKVTRSGNNLTVTRANADAALIGRTQQVITATPKKQQVPFTMKHVGAKVKITLTGYLAFNSITATLASINATDVPVSSIYDASTGTWTAGVGAAVSANTTYSMAFYKGLNKYVADSNEEIMFIPSTDVSKLKLTFTAGNIYLENIAGNTLIFNPASTLKLEQNGAYVLNINLKYNFLYLMSDGSVGTVRETIYGSGTKTPIAVVLSQSKRMAMALQELNGGAIMQWCGNTYHYAQANTHDVTNIDDALNSQATSGIDETWNASYSTGSIGVKATNPDFYPFYAAANYNPGIVYTGSPALQWYLPSYSDFKWLFALGRGNKATVTQGEHAYTWHGDLANVACVQVGGAEFINDRWYWSSSEYQLHAAGYVAVSRNSFYWSNNNKSNGVFCARAFVKY